MKKIIRLTESDLVRIVKKVINEQVPLLTVLSNPSLVSLSSSNDDQTILLSQRNPQNTAEILPKSTYKYTFKGSYGKFADFDLEMTNVRRTPKGGLWAKVRPSSWAIRAPLFALIPEVNPKNPNEKWLEKFNGKTWLNVYVDPQKLNSALSTLKNSSGKYAVIDAANGVSLKIKYAGEA